MTSKCDKVDTHHGAPVAVVYVGKRDCRKGRNKVSDSERFQSKTQGVSKPLDPYFQNLCSVMPRRKHEVSANALTLFQGDLSLWYQGVPQWLQLKSLVSSGELFPS